MPRSNRQKLPWKHSYQNKRKNWRVVWLQLWHAHHHASLNPLKNSGSLFMYPFLLLLLLLIIIIIITIIIGGHGNLSPDIILCGWQGSKLQLNQLTNHGNPRQLDFYFASLSNSPPLLFFPPPWWILTEADSCVHAFALITRVDTVSHVMITPPLLIN